MAQDVEVRDSKSRGCSNDNVRREMRTGGYAREADSRSEHASGIRHHLWCLQRCAKASASVFLIRRSTARGVCTNRLISDRSAHGRYETRFQFPALLLQTCRTTSDPGP